MKNPHTLFLFIASLVGGAANAQIFESTVSVSASREDLGQSTIRNANTVGSLAAEATVAGVYSTATTINQVGILKTYTSTTASGAANILTKSDSYARAYFADSLTVTGSSPHASGSLLVNLSFEGRLTGQDKNDPLYLAHADSSVDIDAFTGSGTLLNTHVFDGEVNYAHGSVLQYEIPFNFGEVTPIALQLTSRVESSTLGAAGITVAAESNFSNSLYWGGISGVRIDGVVHPLSEFIIASGSGANYANSFAPVPEPAEYVGLFACGLVAFGLIKRRKI